MLKTKKLGIKVNGGHIRLMQLALPPEQGEYLDSCQAIINATSPPGGSLNKNDVVWLALEMLYKKLKPQHKQLEKLISDIRATTGIAIGDEDKPKRVFKRKKATAEASGNQEGLTGHAAGNGKQAEASGT